MIKLKVKEIKGGYDVRAKYKNDDIGEVLALISDLYSRLEEGFGVPKKEIPTLVNEFERSFQPWTP